MSTIVQPGAMVNTQAFANSPISVAFPHIAPVDPTSSDVRGDLGYYPIGKRWINTVGQRTFELVAYTTVQNVTTAVWAAVATTSGDIDTITTDDTTVVVPTAGNVNLVGGSNINTTGSGSNATVNLDNSPSVSGSVTAATGFIATAGGVTNVDAASVAGASPVANNVRSGQASFTDVINAGAYGTLTLTNSVVSDNTKFVLACASCATANTACSIVQITPASGSVAFRVFNGGAANTAANILINFTVLN